MINNDNVEFMPSKFFISDENGKHIIAEYDGEVINKSQECKAIFLKLIEKLMMRI